MPILTTDLRSPHQRRSDQLTILKKRTLPPKTAGRFFKIVAETVIGTFDPAFDSDADTDGPASASSIRHPDLTVARLRSNTSQASMSLASADSCKHVAPTSSTQSYQPCKRSSNTTLQTSPTSSSTSPANTLRPNALPSLTLSNPLDAPRLFHTHVSEHPHAHLHVTNATRPPSRPYMTLRAHSFPTCGGMQISLRRCVSCSSASACASTTSFQLKMINDDEAHVSAVVPKEKPTTCDTQCHHHHHHPPRYDNYRPFHRYREKRATIPDSEGKPSENTPYVSSTRQRPRSMTVKSATTLHDDESDLMVSEAALLEDTRDLRRSSRWTISTMRLSYDDEDQGVTLSIISDSASDGDASSQDGQGSDLSQMVSHACKHWTKAAQGQGPVCSIPLFVEEAGRTPRCAIVDGRVKRVRLHMQQQQQPQPHHHRNAADPAGKKQKFLSSLKVWDFWNSAAGLTRAAAFAQLCCWRRRNAKSMESSPMG